MTTDFDLVCSFDEIGILEKGDKAEDSMRMYGWASTPGLDSDGERIVQEGLDTSDLLNKGWINWNHQSEKIIGIPKVAELRDRGDGLGKGLYTEFDLLKSHPLAQEVWMLAKSLKGTGRSLGLSLEGKKLAVGPKKNIMKARVMNIAVCPNPKNSETSAEALVKAIATGEEDVAEKFSPIDANRSEIAERVESVVASVLTKALDAGTDTGGATQTGGAAIRKESVEGQPADLVQFSEDYAKKANGLEGDLKTIGNALAGIADKRGGRLTKAESALFTFLISDHSLVDCFKVFGLEP